MLQSVLFGPVQRSVVGVLAGRLAASAEVLDIGCGTGRLLDQIHTVLPLATPVGIDRSTGMVTAARRLRPHLRIEQGCAEALPHRDRSFDAVVTTISFHHWIDKEAAIGEVRRVLRPGGLFALTDISVDDLPGWPRQLWDVARRPMADMPALKERHRLLEATGLQVLEVIPTLRRRWVRLTLAQRPAVSPHSG
jgi:SAM-dependent methyltransferase